MHITQISDDVLVDDTIEEEDLLGRVGSLLLDKLVLFIVKQHEAFHLTNVLHDLILLHQVISHALLNHVTSGHVPSDGSLKHHRVRLDSHKDLSEPAHTED